MAEQDEAGARLPPALTIGRSVAEFAAFHGIASPELTPRIRSAFAALLNEVGQLRTEVDELRDRIGHLERLADEDVMMPVLNRRAFVRELTRTAAYVDRYGGEAGIIYVDINGMKRINDGWGHAAGDAALARVADLLMANVRGSDAVGRLGGDEFGILLTHADETATVEKAAKIVRIVGENPLSWRGDSIVLSVSAGAYVLRQGASAQSALDEADQAMYAQKRSQTA